MQTRTLGNSGLDFTTVGIGTWAVGGGNWAFGWGDQDEREAIEGILKGVELGINWIDTAAIYGGGASEELVGKALREIPVADRPYVATKCGRVMHADRSISACLKKESVLAECEASLQRLGVEAIDLYQLHWPQPDEDIEEGWAALVELLEAGKVKHIAVSNHSVEQMKRLQAIHPIASLQPPYNMLNREVENEILPFCAAEKIGVVCYSPMAKGLLSGAFTAERVAALPENDHRRSRDPQFSSPQLEANLALVEALRPIAEEHGRPLAQLAIAWTLRRPELTSAIVGVRRADQIAQTAGASDWTLTNEETCLIERVLGERMAK